MPSSVSALKKLISENHYDSAVICPKEAAKDFQMVIMDEKIEDYEANTTRFVVIGKSNLENRTSKNNKTSIAFYFSADAPGTLYQVLGEFSIAKVNMTKIESSANLKIPGGNVFYVDFEGSIEDANVKKMLTRIKKLVEKLKILGCY